MCQGSGTSVTEVLSSCHTSVFSSPWPSTFSTSLQQFWTQKARIGLGPIERRKISKKTYTSYTIELGGIYFWYDCGCWSLAATCRRYAAYNEPLIASNVSNLCMLMQALSIFWLLWLGTCSHFSELFGDGLAVWTFLSRVDLLGFESVGPIWFYRSGKPLVAHGLLQKQVNCFACEFVRPYLRRCWDRTGLRTETSTDLNWQSKTEAVQVWFAEDLIGPSCLTHVSNAGSGVARQARHRADSMEARSWHSTAQDTCRGNLSATNTTERFLLSF